MKKILILAMIFMVAMPTISAFAYAGGLLNGKQMKVGAYLNHTSPIYNGNVTDSNDATGLMIDYSGGSYDTVWYQFAEGHTITAVKSLADSTGLVVKFYNASLVQQGVTHEVSTNSSQSGIIPTENVIFVEITNPTATSINLKEVDVFGEPTPTQTISYDTVTNVQETHTHNTVNLTWTNPTGAEFTGTIVKKDGIEVANLANNITSYNGSGLTANTTYNYEVLAKYSDGVNSTPQAIAVTTSAEPVDNAPPGEITNVMVEKTSNTVSFVYSLPTDTDFAYLNVYRDNVLLKTNHTTNTYDDSGLVANTAYNYKFTSVDTSGNESTGTNQTVTTNVETDTQAPTTPTNPKATNGNASAQLTWDMNTETDLDGYNVFVNGVKHNTTVVKANNYTFPNLDNGTSYDLTVSAVDTSGNESMQTVAQTVVPSKMAMPMYEMQYDLKDVADGTSSWFNSLWLIVAFAVAIPLSFLIGGRIKSLFIS